VKRLFVRVDSSNEIGTGHVYRCLSVAKTVASFFEVHFICRQFKGHSAELIKSRGFVCHLLPDRFDNELSVNFFDEPILSHSHWLHSSQHQDAIATLTLLNQMFVAGGDCLLVDHFAISEVWEKYILEQTYLGVIALDGQADRAHCSDFLFDPTLCNELQKWNGKITKTTHLEQGLEVVPLHEDFYKARPKSVVRTSLQRILVCFGGSDQYDYTGQALQLLRNQSLDSLEIRIIVGQNYLHWVNLQKMTENKDNVLLLRQVETMPKQMLWADLAIGAGGSMAWERCLLGLPVLCVGIAHNQYKQVACLQQIGIGLHLGNSVKEMKMALLSHIDSLSSSPESLTRMSKNAFKLTEDCRSDKWLLWITAASELSLARCEKHLKE
jgi:UDP-2,4-diacetamido-2,4,6-trideoxy-beta-L-altropyranose hydrolase